MKRRKRRAPNCIVQGAVPKYAPKDDSGPRGRRTHQWSRRAAPIKGRWRSRRLWKCLATVCSLLAWAGLANAAVRLDMFVGYDGVVPQGSWFPIAFEVQNDGPTFNSLIEIAPGQFGGAQNRTIQVELPTGTTKRFVVPIFAAASYNPSWNARLTDERGHLRAEASSQRLRRYNESILPLAAALTRTMPPLPELKGRQEEFRPVFARLQPAVFPDNPLSLDGLDTLYLSSERALELKANQVGTLLAWLHGGGHLIVGLEQVSHLSGSGEWLRQVLPAEPTSVMTVTDHSAIQDWLSSDRRFNGLVRENSNVTRRNRAGPNPYAQVTTEPSFEQAPMEVMECRLKDGRALIGSKAKPLAIIAERGRGQITLLPFAPELEPFRSWKNAPMFWAKMIDLPPDLLVNDRGTYYGGRPVDGIFGAMIDSEQARKLPVGWLLLLLVAYLLVIGPLDQYWLKKLNRQMLTWLTFPAYVVFFSLLIYFIGYKLRAGETEWTELHVLDVTGHGVTADLRGRSFGSIYSPVNARYNFASEEPFAVMRGEFSGNYGGGQDANRGTVEQRSAGFRANASVPVWTSQLFLSDWWRQAPAPINVTTTASEIIVDNQLDVKLTFVRLVERELDHEYIYELGEVPAQEKKTFPRRGKTTTSLDVFVQSHSSHFQQAVNARHQAFGDNTASRIRDWTNAAMAASFITTVNTPNNYENFNPPPGFDLSPLIERGDSVLLAWAADYSPTKPLNQFSATRHRKNTLLRVLVPQKP